MMYMSSHKLCPLLRQWTGNQVKTQILEFESCFQLLSFDLDISKFGNVFMLFIYPLGKNQNVHKLFYSVLKKIGDVSHNEWLIDYAAAYVVFLLSTNANAMDTAESNPAVRNTRSYDWADGYDPCVPILSWSAR